MLRSIAPKEVLANAVVAAAAMAISAGACAAPITILNPGYWLETVGTNTIGLAGGGDPGGRVTTLFVANTNPSGAQGTSATASLAGVPTRAPTEDATGLWARRALADATERQPLTVQFSNGGDTATFTGRDLTGLAAMPLVQNLAIDAAGQPLGPLITWDLPTGNDFDIDLVQLVFYNDDTNLEIGTRQVRPANTTSYDIVGPLPLGLNLVINVRLIDLADDSAPFTVSNILRASRAYINYSVPTSVPEPGTFALAALALTCIGAFRLRTR